MAKKTFKPYSQHQTTLFPMNLGSMIPEGHPVRVLSTVIDSIDLSTLLKDYSSMGASSFDPRMMLKVLIYAYLNNIYSTRKIENSLSENIHMMWLSGMQKPDHNTISRFRSGKLKPHIKTIFFKIVRFLMDQEQLDLSVAYTDGTKIESKANKYTFVWAKTIQNSKKRIEKNLEELWAYAEKLATDELRDRKPSSFKPVSTDQVSKITSEISDALKDKKVSKKMKQKLNYVKKTQAPKVDQYNKHEENLAGRSSYSKTDHEATFMRMKDDHMRNGQLKPAYNVQGSTQNGYVVNYTLHQTAGDSTTFIDHYQQLQSFLGTYPSIAVADSGYGSEENNQFLEDQDIENVVKFAGFHKEQRTKKPDNSDLSVNSLHYNEKENYLVCPMGQQMHFKGVKEQKSSTGFLQKVHVFEAINCHSCPLHSRCFKSKHKYKNREVTINLNAKRLRNKARKNLLSKEGEKLRKQRCAEVEQMFGQLKGNKGFKRFLLKGLDKIEVELGLVFLSMNIMKYARNIQKGLKESIFSNILHFELQISGI